MQGPIGQTGLTGSTGPMGNCQAKADDLGFEAVGQPFVAGGLPEQRTAVIPWGETTLGLTGITYDFRSTAFVAH